MKAVITSSQPNFKLHSSAKVFVQSNADKLVDTWFSDQKVYALEFKSKTWSKMKALAAKANVAALRQIFDGKLSYSHKCGCSCGCSPGYNLRNISNDKIADLARKEFWVDVETETDAIEKYIPFAHLELQLEILEHA
jgi:hypothetical protein